MSEENLSQEDRDSLSDVLDALIPASADGRLPAAGSLGIGDSVWAGGADMRPAIREGLATVRSLSREHGAANLGALSDADRALVLEAISAQHPLFMPGLIFHTYVHYYQHDQVMEALGLEARPPHPKGFDLELGDLSLLDPVRDRGPLA